MQHIRLIFSEGFRPISRLHLSMGAMSYLSSPLWLLFMVLSAIGIMLDDPATGHAQQWASLAAVFILLGVVGLIRAKTQRPTRENELAAKAARGSSVPPSGRTAA